MDLTSASARRYFFEVASTFASHPQEAERLRHFAGKDGRDELWYYNERERRSVGEFLSDFPSVAMPLEWMLTTAPRLRHRLFSISSSPLPHPHALHLTVTAAQVEDTLRSRPRRFVFQRVETVRFYFYFHTGN